ncbi:MAG TPA: SGNH hydrolase domain-containing protein [Acidimicrobiia bacterium]|nr:SGNH hydrolase domain-containing protein [Acidimicrobiia bacterium]
MFGRSAAGAPRRGLLATIAVVGAAAVITGAAIAGYARWSTGAPTALPSHSLRATSRAVFDDATAQLDAVLAHSPMPAPTTVAAPHPTPLIRPGVGSRPLRILVVGDSVGVSFGKGLQQWAAQNGHAQVLDLARFYCPLGRRLPIVQGLFTHAASEGCDWTQRWKDAVRDFDPDVTFVLFSIWEVSPRQLPGRADFLAPGAQALDAWQLSEYRAAADELSARDAPIVWFTIPCERVENRPGMALWDVDHHTIPALAASNPAVKVVDLDRAICANGPMSSFGGVATPRPDGAHFSLAGALAVSNWVMPIVLGQAPNPR